MLRELVSKADKLNSVGKTLYIGIGGAGRSGKDTLAEALVKSFAKVDIWAQRFALAEPLKQKMYDFIKDNFGVDIYTCSDEEKALIRPLLVEFGRVKRIQTKGTYFTSLLDEKIEKLGVKPDVVIVSDVRYTVYDGTDEMYWLKNHGGELLFVERQTENGIVPPANVDEELNNIVLKEKADHLIQWKSFNCPQNEIITYATEYLWKNFDK